jgi:site-specific DNA-methyltransferase (cytosine-N4-specific)
MVIDLSYFTNEIKIASPQIKNVDDICFDLDSIKNKNYLTHNFHPYPAKVIPQIPKKIIETLTEPYDSIFDPFCGCGTSLVEAKLSGRHSVGVDINPLACMVAKVKTTPLNEMQLAQAKKISEDVNRDINSFNGKSILEDHKVIDLEAPDFYNVHHWFQDNIINELAIAMAHINKVLDETLRDFLKVAFSSIIVSVSNQESDTRYVAINKNLKNGIVGKLFSLKILDMIKRIKNFGELSRSVDSIVYCADSRNVSFINDEFFDLVITSPPYLNTYDYYLYHKTRMMWLGLDYRDAQEKEIGSRHKHCDKNEGLEVFVDNIGRTMDEMNRVLKLGKYCCIIIGDSILKGRLIKTDSILNKLAEDRNLSLKKEIVFNQRKYSRTFTPNMKNGHKNSYILIYQKN